MVHSFIIANLNCKILYSNTFCFKQNALTNSDVVDIASKVKSEFDFNFSVSNSSKLDASNMPALDFETKGVFNFKINDHSKPIVFHSFCGCLYILVCDSTDNRLLAFRTLISLIRTLREVIPKITSFTSEIMVRGDAVSMTVNAFIPSGQLLFLHDQAVQQISKELQKNSRS